MLSSVSEFRFMVPFPFMPEHRSDVRVCRTVRACMFAREIVDADAERTNPTALKQTAVLFEFVQIFSVADTFGAEFPFDYGLVMHLLAAGPAPAARRALRLL